MAPEVNFVANDTQGWVEIDISPLTPSNDDDPAETRVIPFRVIGNRYKSSSPDCELFIHDPLAVLLEARETGADKVRDVLKDVNVDWRVITYVVNHEANLGNFHMYALASVAHTSGEGPGAARMMVSSETTIAITIWKLPFNDKEAPGGAVVRAAREALRSEPPR